jgi:hypothetical protein
VVRGHSGSHTSAAPPTEMQNSWIHLNARWFVGPPLSCWTRRSRSCTWGKGCGGRVREHVRCCSCGHCDRRGGQTVDDRYSRPSLNFYRRRDGHESLPALCSGSVHSNPSSTLYPFPSSRPSGGICPRRLLIGLTDYPASSSLLALRTLHKSRLL